MKKKLAITLALVMALGLFTSCGQTDTGTASDAAETTDETVAADTTAEETTAAEPSDTASAGDSSLAGKKLAYFAITMSNIWLQNMQEWYDGYGAAEGVEVVNADADFSAETQLSQIDTLLNDGLDGAVVFVADEGSGPAVVEKFKNANVPVIGESLRLMDGDGKLVAPVVELDAIGVGKNCAEWVAENYLNYDYDFSDLASVGVLLSTRSTYQSDVNRSEGFSKALLSSLPEIPEANYYTADCAAEANASDDAEAAYAQVTAVLTAHPEISTWILFGSVDDYALGAARAVEAAGLEDSVMITSCGGERAVIEWENGDSSCWVSTCYYDVSDFAVTVLDGLSQMIGGTAAEDLWPEYIDEGEQYASYKINGTMATPDTYQEIMAAGSVN